MPELAKNEIDERMPAAADLSDAEVIERVLAGHRAAFEIVMRRYNRRLFRIIRGLVGCDDESEDVLQETYVRAYTHLHQFAGRSQFSTWLTKIAVYAALARAKRRNRMKPTDFTVADNASLLFQSRSYEAEQRASNEELGAVLAQAIDDLPTELRMVFVMRMVEDISTHETADCLGLSEANVKVRMHRARAILRQRIDAEIGTEARQMFEFGGSRCDRVVRSVLARLT